MSSARIVRVLLNVLLGPPMFVGAAVCSGAAVAAHMGRTDLRLDILAHFAPLWLAGALLAIVGGFLFQGYFRMLVIVMAAPGVVAASALMAPEFLRDTGPEAPADAPGQIKVVQLNAWRHSDDNQPTVDWVAAEAPDILIVQEAAIPTRQAIAERTGMHLLCDTCQVTIFSRQAPDPDFPMHPNPERSTPIIQARFRDGRGPFHVVGVHNGWPTDIADQQRQEARLAETLGQLPLERVIVTGDFNSTPWSNSRRRWDRTFGVIRRDRAIFSWPARQGKQLRELDLIPFLPIDHVYAGPAWGTVKVERGPQVGSDHFPIVMTLAPVSPP